MIRVSVFYPNSPESTFNFDYYITQYIPKVEALLKPRGLHRLAIDQGMGTPMPNEPAPFSLITHLIFNNFEEMEMAMGEHGQELMADVPNFTNVQPVVQISKMV